MPWLNDLFGGLIGKKVDVEAIKHKMQTTEASTTLTDSEITGYVDDIEARVQKMVKDLKNIYSKYGVVFLGFKSFEMACDSLRDAMSQATEESYNNLVKIDSAVTSEQKRHLALIRMAVTKDGKRVMDKIMQDPLDKQTFGKIFGERYIGGSENVDGIYQRLWSELHKISEYILIQKNRVYH